MKRILKFIMVMAVISTAVSCVDFNWEKNLRNKIDNNNTMFAQMVGKIDPDHTWNLAKEGSVTVNTQYPMEIQVSTLDNTLLAKKTVDGKEKVAFDILAGLNEVKVACADGVKVVNLGSEVRFGSLTRAVDPSKVNKFSGEYFHALNANKTLNLKIETIDSNAKSLTIGTYIYENWTMKETEVFKDINPLDYSKGATNVRINLDNDDCFGVFVVVDGVKYYSEAMYNDDKTGHAKYVNEKMDINHTSHNPYIFFEDGLGEFDFNDIVLKFSGNEDLELAPADTRDGYWLVGCEDVYGGDRCDNDFNDVVFAVNYVAGQPKMKIKFLAAGSTIANDLYLGETKIGEIHDLLWNGETSYQSVIGGKEITTYKMCEKNGVTFYNMINTNRKGCILAPVTVEVDVPQSFSMSRNIGGFSIRRYDETSGHTYVSKITAPEKGCVPYMICVPDDWRWPSENVAIWTVYPEFPGWSLDHSTNLDWYKEFSEDPEAGHIVY